MRMAFVQILRHAEGHNLELNVSDFIFNLKTELGSYCDQKLVISLFVPLKRLGRNPETVRFPSQPLLLGLLNTLF